MTENSSTFQGSAYVSTDYSKPNRFQDGMKRALDLMVSAVGMILLSPLFIYVVIRIKIDSPGPVFFKGNRVGRNGKIFEIQKFRTMYEAPDSFNGPRITAKDDPRITPFGHWLRESKLNEIPQLWNVFIGEMSLVGPRPEDPAIVEGWPEEAKKEILSIRPGITSPASVVYRDEESLLPHSRLMDTYIGEISPSKLRLDQLYVRHRTFWGDLDILFWTLLVLIPQVKTLIPGERQFFLGPITSLRRRYINWFALDVLVVFVSMGITGLIWRSFGPLEVGRTRALGLALGFALLYSLVNAFLGVYRIDWSHANSADAFDLVPGAIVGTIIALVSNHLVHLTFIIGQGFSWSAEPLLPPIMILVASTLSFIGFLVVRYRGRLLTGLASRWLAWRGVTSTTLERVLIIGGGETGQYAAWVLNSGRYAGTFSIIGFADDDLYKQGIRIQGVHVIGSRNDIHKLVKKHDIGIIIFAIHNISAKERNQLLEFCTATPARVVIFPNIPAALSGITINDYVKKDPSGKQSVPAYSDSTIDGKLPCHLCLIKVSPLKVDGWLAQLEMYSESGDMSGLRTEIQEYRNQLHGDVKTQVEANLGREDN